MAHRLPLHIADKHFEMLFGDGRLFEQTRQKALLNEEFKRAVELSGRGGASNSGQQTMFRILCAMSYAEACGKFDCPNVPIMRKIELFSGASFGQSGISIANDNDIFMYDKWSHSRQVIRFDPDLTRELYKAADDVGTISPTILNQLPYDTFFVEADGLRAPDRVSVMSAIGVGDKVRERIPLIDVGGFYITTTTFDGGSFASVEQLSIDIIDRFGRGIDEHFLSIGMASIEDAIKEEYEAGYLGYFGVNEQLKRTPLAERGKMIDMIKRNEEAREAMLPYYADLLKKSLALVIYLCTSSCRPVSAGVTPRFRAKSRQPGCKTRDTLGKTPLFLVGADFGESYRAYCKSVGDGSREVRPHMRRGHFHSFWTGPLNKPDERKLVVHWVDPVFVNKHLGPLITTEHRVRG